MRWIKSLFKRKKSEFTHDASSNQEINIYEIDKSLQSRIQELEEEKNLLHRKSNVIKDLRSMSKMSEDENNQLARALNSVGQAKVQKDYIKEELHKINIEQVPEAFYGDFDKVLHDLQRTEEKQSLSKSDMHHLEGEKGYLDYEKEKYDKLLKAVRYIGFGMCLLIGVAIFAFTLLYTYISKNLMIPIIILFSLTLFSVIWVYLWKRHINYTLSMNSKKQEKAIQLLNKAKLRYARHTNYLEFAYKKYGVNNISELTNLWQRYQVFKDTNSQYREVRHYESGVMATMENIFTTYNVVEEDYVFDHPEHMLTQKTRKAFGKELAEDVKKHEKRIKELEKEVHNYWQVIYGLREREPSLKKEIDALIEGHIN